MMCWSNAVKLLATTAMLVVSSEQISFAAEVDGGIIVRMEDVEKSRCINAKTDAITFQLVRARETKYSSLLSADKTIGLYIETTLEGASGGMSRRVSFPRAFVISVDEYDGGTVSLPVEQRLLSQFRLTNGDNAYTSAGFAIRLVKTQKAGPVANAIKVLADVTKQLPIPANPLSAGFEFFVDLSNNLVENFLNKELNSDNNASRAQISFEFSPNGDCTGALETTGALAIIFKEDGGSIDLSKEGNYCFRYVLSPTKRVEYATKENGGCPDPSKYGAVSNPYYLFLLVATQRESAGTKTTRLIWSNSMKGLQPTYDPKDVQEIYSSWQRNNAESPNDASKYIAAIDNFAKADWQTNPGQFGIGTTWSGDSVDKAISGIAGAEPFAWNKTMIGQQTISVEDATAQDIATSLRRCNLYGIAADSCL